jgi:predicted dehydrogenase
MNTAMTRRTFLGQVSAAAAVAGAAMPVASFSAATAPRRNFSANEKLRTAVIGTNGRGLVHLQCLTEIPGVEITHVCDVDDRAIAKGLQAAKKQSTSPRGVKDFRRILEDRNVDAVTIATPDHWHAPMAILALAAGKHVYLEKPCSHNPQEGEWLMEAVRKSGCVFQMGNQRRSFPNMQQAMREIREGVIGKTYFAKAWYANGRVSIGHGKPAPVPAWLDYELWQGPAPRHPFQDNLVHYNWHWFWRYGTGEALNNGTHEVDVCRWALGVNFPVRVSSIGGRYAYQDDWETPDTQVIGWDFPEGKSITWEGRSCNRYPVEKLDRGSIIYGTGGAVLLDNDSYTVFDSKNKVVKEIKGKTTANPTDPLSGSGIELDALHFKTFVDAVRNGKQVTSPVDEAHKSVLMLHLGNIAWRTGHELHCDPQNGHIQKDAEASKLWRRTYERGWEPRV